MIHLYELTDDQVEAIAAALDDRLTALHEYARDYTPQELTEARSLCQDALAAIHSGPVGVAQPTAESPCCGSSNLRYGRNLTGCSDCRWHEEE